MDASGLASSLLDSESNYIDVCGNTCVLDEDASTADQAVCTLPHVSTSYSASEYEIVTSGMIHDGTWWGTASDAELAKLTDDKNMIDLIDNYSPCFFDIQYKKNHVGVLDEVKFFINDLIDKSVYDGGLVFRGSDDGLNWTDLWAIDASIHEGWNSHDFEEGSKPAFNIYQFYGQYSGSCRVGEVRLHGIEAINNDSSSY